MKSFIFLFVIVLVLEHHGSLQGATQSTAKSASLLTEEQIQEAQERARLYYHCLAEYYLALEEAQERANSSPKYQRAAEGAQEIENSSNHTSPEYQRELEGAQGIENSSNHTSPEYQRYLEEAQELENLSNHTSAEYQTAIEDAQEKSNISNNNSAEYHTAPETEQRNNTLDSSISDDEGEPPVCASPQEYYGQTFTREIGLPLNDRKKPIVAAQNWSYVKDERRRAKAVTLFKNHVLELIQATVQPIRKERTIGGQALSCAKIIKNTKAFATVSLIIQTIQIANKHSRVLTKIAKADGNFAARRCVRNVNLMGGIEKIVDLCLLAEDDFVLNSLESILKDHLENLSPDPSYLSKWTSWFNYDEQSATNCFQLMVTIDYNKEFFEKLLEGFSIVSRNLRRHEKATTAIVETDEEIVAKRQRLADIQRELKKSKLNTPDKDYRKDELEDFCVLLSARSDMEYDRKIDSAKSKFMWLGLFFMAVYTAKGIAWLYR